MIELRSRPQCSGCRARVSSDAPGCSTCGYLLLCDECAALHDHDEPMPEPIEVDTSCVAGQITDDWRRMRSRDCDAHLRDAIKWRDAGRPDLAKVSLEQAVLADADTYAIDEAALSERTAEWLNAIDERIAAAHPGFPHAGYTQARRAS